MESLNFENLIKELFVSRKGIDEKHWNSLWKNYKKSAIVKDLRFIYDKIMSKTVKIDELVKFYLENKDDPINFITQHPEYKEQVSKVLGDDWQNKLTNTFLRNKLILRFNDWLFKLTFKNILKDI